jgi:hypothetical protein
MAKNLKISMGDGEAKGIRGEVVGSLGVTSMGLVHIATGRVIPLSDSDDGMARAHDMMTKLPGTWKAADTYEFGQELPEGVRKAVRNYFGLS